MIPMHRIRPFVLILLLCFLSSSIGCRPRLRKQFKTGQQASVLLGGIDFNQTGGELLFNHPKAIATDGTSLAFCDGNNNRVLVWRTLPETSNTPPDLVLGQPDMDSNDAGDGLGQMNWPAGVSLHEGRLLVADTYNHRILVWNTLPTAHGASADFVLEGIQPGDTFPMEPRKDRFVWPWSVWTDGEKLVVTSTACKAEGGIGFGGWVLIWNEFPTSDDQEADILLTADGDAGTPRGITSNGESLIIGDHNASNTDSPMGAWVWKIFPTEEEENPDYFLTDPDSPTIWLQGDFGSDGSLYIMGTTLQIWNQLPESNSDAPDLSIDNSAFGLRGGDCSGVAVAGEQVFVTDYNGNRVLGFLSEITSDSQNPEVVLGAPDLNTDTLMSNDFITNPAIATDGQSLVIGSGYDRALSLWREIPTESGTPPTVRIEEIDSSSDIVIHQGVLVVAGQLRSLKIWMELPFEGEEPDYEFNGEIGSVEYDRISGVALDDHYFYLADGNGQIHVWSELPTSGEEPLFCIELDGTEYDLQSDGNHLVVSSNSSTMIFEVATLAEDSVPQEIAKTEFISGSRAEAQIDGDRFFLVDFAYNRVLFWEHWEDAVAGEEPDAYLGAEDADDIDSGISRSTLFWPKRMAVSGNRLWVGEYKFSGRIVQFETKPRLIRLESADLFSPETFPGKRFDR
ncbi:MAG: hypothetical protein QF752_16245 [Planctomycetota bacterium]|nr:hypothetical protein [Planctomycetota bacterium]